MSENLLDCYAERIQAWRKASASMSYSAIDPKRNAVELYDELAALKRHAKTLPDKLKWIADNASHHSSHWLHTQLYGMAKELEYGYINMGTKDFYKVDALIAEKDAK